MGLGVRAISNSWSENGNWHNSSSKKYDFESSMPTMEKELESLAWC
jgi:hypothetical protein